MMGHRLVIALTVMIFATVWGYADEVIRIPEPTAGDTERAIEIAKANPRVQEIIRTEGAEVERAMPMIGFTLINGKSAMERGFLVRLRGREKLWNVFVDIEKGKVTRITPVNPNFLPPGKGKMEKWKGNKGEPEKEPIDAKRTYRIVDKKGKKIAEIKLGKAKAEGREASDASVAPKGKLAVLWGKIKSIVRYPVP